jgi:serine/threonine-protein kinase RsbW
MEEAGAASITLANRLEEIARVTGFLESFAARHHLSDDVGFALTLAMDEVVTNIARHGYPAGEAGEIVVRIRMDAGTVVLQVEDAGRPFNPLDAPPVDLDAPLEGRPIGGLGIHLIRSLMDQVEYRREDGRNVLVMRKGT